MRMPIHINNGHTNTGLTISNKPFCNVVVWVTDTGVCAVHARWYLNEKRQKQAVADLSKSWSNPKFKTHIVSLTNDYKTHCFKTARILVESIPN